MNNLKKWYYSISRLNKRQIYSHETFKVLETLKVFLRETLYPSLRHILFCLVSGVFLSIGCVPQLFAEEAKEAEQFSLSALKTGEVLFSWDELKKLLEEIETLKLDIERLKKEKAQAQKAQKEPLPVEYSITESHFTGEVKGSSAQFKAKFSVQVLKDGWLKVPFFHDDVGIEAININVLKPLEPSENGAIATDDSTISQPTAIRLQNEQKEKATLAQFVRDTQGYYLLAKGPKAFTIQVTFRVPIQVKGLIYRLSFMPPRAVINHVTLRIAEKGINVVQKTAHSLIKEENGITTIETVLSERDTLKLGWKVEKDSSISRKSRAILHSLASVDKSDISVSSTIVLKHVGSLNNIAFHFPLNVEIVNVTSLDIEQWATEKLEESQVIKMTGHSDPRSAVKIDMSYRLRLSSLPADIAIPAVEIMGTDTLEGFLGVEVLGNLEVNAKQVKSGILIPAKNLPKKLWQKAANPLLYGYQFYGNTFRPSLSIRRYQEIQTVVANVYLVDCVTHRTLEGKSITRILYFIRNNDRQFLTLTLPKNSRIWQVFLNGKPVKPAQKDTGEILVPMKKSASQGGDLQSFSIEMGYITEVNKLSLKGDILNQLPAIDIPISYLRWRLYLPEYYEYSKFEGLLKKVAQFSKVPKKHHFTKPQIDIPTQGRRFLFEKHLIVEGRPYIRGKYGQFLGDDLFLSIHSSGRSQPPAVKRKADRMDFMPKKSKEAEVYEYDRQEIPQQQIAPNMF